MFHKKAKGHARRRARGCPRLPEQRPVRVGPSVWRAERSLEVRWRARSVTVDGDAVDVVVDLGELPAAEVSLELSVDGVLVDLVGLCEPPP